MTIHIYESKTALSRRRFIAQFEMLKDNLFLVIHGPTAEIAKAKAELHLQYRALPPNERKAFDLSGQLEALNDGKVEVLDEDEDDLL